ncbi:hypothetical protein HPB49_007320 [Dermacentor silvarum]|uniref:Uncharacterized protein n=1 Tax=Dermacentor silvarum TaxID=543639 RepID=A0ACB8DN94_DERSI|nr:hypothetical protein HPB49_007320 [Dermacentor silvarum]
MLCRLQLTHTARAKDLCQMSPVEAMEKYPYLADKEWDERVPLTPCVVYSGHNLEQAEFLHLCVDKERLFMVKNAEEGVMAIMSAFFCIEHSIWA